MFTHRYYDNHERVHVFNLMDGRLQGFIALHNTKLGPGLGGCRVMDYASPNLAMEDVLNLSRGMTYKSAFANLPLGGGKAVIMANNYDGSDRKEFMEHFAWEVNTLNGDYWTAVDVGTSLRDMENIYHQCDYVCGVRKHIVGSTAKGAFRAIEAACEWQGENIGDMSFMIQGLGQTGWRLAERLHQQGARLFVTDINQNLVDMAMHQFPGTISVDPNVTNVLSQDVDVFVPCALGGVITWENMHRIKAHTICGTANNVLADENIAALLHRIGILYVPDFVANAGGVIAAADDVYENELFERDASYKHEIENIFERTMDILEASARTDVSPDSLARDIVREMIY